MGGSGVGEQENGLSEKCPFCGADPVCLEDGTASWHCGTDIAGWSSGDTDTSQSANCADVQIQQLEERLAQAERERDDLQQEIQRIIAPVEAGGGVDSHLRAEIARLRGALEGAVSDIVHAEIGLCELCGGVREHLGDCWVDQAQAALSRSGGQTTAPAHDDALSVLAWLVRLRDETKQADPERYEREREQAWQAARRLVGGSVGKTADLGPGTRAVPVGNIGGVNVTLTCMREDARNALDHAIETWQAIVAERPQPPEDPVYSFAYWLFRYSGLLQYEDVDPPATIRDAKRVADS